MIIAKPQGMPRVAVGLNGKFLAQFLQPAPFLQFPVQKVVVDARPLLTAFKLRGALLGASPC